MSESEKPGRRLRFTLVVRDEKDDPSILDMVSVAAEDGSRGTKIFIATPIIEQTGNPAERHSPVSEELEDAARHAIEEVLAKVSVPADPHFGPAKWAERLSKLWAVIRTAQAAGVRIRITPTEPFPSIEGA